VCDVAWLADGVPAWRARAATPVRALAFRVEDWFDLLEEHFEMVRATLRALARQREQLAT
jgi:CRP-like cAMP-binding protein